MNIIISPAKKMNICNDDLTYKTIPALINKTSIIYSTLKALSYDELKVILSCNSDIATLNYERYLDMDIMKNLTPAILAYEGIQYKYMAPNIFTTEQFKYVEKHLKILSGFYGILNAFDGVVPYRLEMQAKLKLQNSNNLYDFWGETIYNELIKTDNTILNLASKEYSKVIEKYLKPEDKYITCIFGSLKDSKIKVKATEAKMARGLMVRYMSEHNITDIEKIKNFSELSFSYSNSHSTTNKFVFLK